MSQEFLKIVIVGHVDHGKSTLVGRLFHDTGSLPDGKFEAIQETCKKRGVPFEWAFLMDALQAERDQGITIDTAQIWFNTDKRNYVIIDAPGHKEFLKNMITGAAASDAAVLVIDADEGVQEQSKRHGYLLHLMGIRQIAVAVNKMDLVNYDQKRFEQVEREYRQYLADIGVEPTFIIPVSAREGDNIASPMDRMPWYDGPSIVEALDHFQPVTALLDLPLRMPIQDIYKFDDRRILAGRVESGQMQIGDTLVFSPSNKTAKISSIEAWNRDVLPSHAQAGQSVGITLDQQIFVERGEVASLSHDMPVETDVFRAKLFWLGDQPLTVGSRYKMKLNTTELPVEVQAIENVVDTDDLAISSGKGVRVEKNSVAEIILRTKRLVALDNFNDSPRTGRLVLSDGYDIAGGGIISMDGYADQRNQATRKATNITRVEHDITLDDRARQNGHFGGVIWMTGLSGAGKSTLAIALEQRLFNLGYQTYVLDGDNVRFGLNSDLAFSPEDRAENIRRVGEVAALFGRAGVITISAFISPYRSDRDRARTAAGAAFHEVYVAADVDVCEQRDPKGLYKRARSGEIEEFTGISAPYEAPESPDLLIDTGDLNIDLCVDRLVEYVQENFTSDGKAKILARNG